MTERQKRLARLVSLRQQQHERAVTGLRAAHNHLHAAVEHMERSVSHAGVAHMERNEALRDAEHERWQLACADSQTASLHLAHAVRNAAEREKAVLAAAEQETFARREFRQMERMMERMRDEHSVIDARKEQQRLDESARLLRMRSSRMPFG